MMKILVLGPRFNKNYPDITGGAIVLFEELINQLEKNNTNYICIDTNKKKYKNLLFACLSITFQIFLKHKDCNYISLHSSKDYIFFGPILILIGRLFNKKTSLRKFGGEAAVNYHGSGRIKNSILKFIFANMDILFFETKYLVEFFTTINKKTFLFPNVRNRLLQPKLPRFFHKRFVFISTVRKEKGIDEILHVSKLLGKNYIIDIYGPIFDKKYTNEYFENFNVFYKGLLSPNQVISKLNEYDILLLPTYYKGEGYPGIIIEAYSLGIPCITTTLKGIKEIVDNYKTGVLIEPKNVVQLLSKIQYFNNENYKVMSENAYQKFDEFNSDIQTKLFLERLSDA